MVVTVLILDITDDELNIVRNVWNMFLITVKAVLYLTKIDKSTVFTAPKRYLALQYDGRIVLQFT